MIQNEIRTTLHSKLLYIAIILGLCSTLTGLFSYYDNIYFYKATGRIENISAYQAWLECLSLGSTFYRLIVPLLIIVRLDSLYIERESGYSNFIITRCSHLKYYLVKLISGITTAVFVVFFVLSVTLTVCMIIFPLNLPIRESTYINYSDAIQVYTKKPILYIGYLIALNVFFAVAYFSIGFAFTPYIRNRYLLMLCPFIIFFLQNIMWQALSIPEMSPLMFIAPYEISGLKKYSIAIPAGIAICLSVTFNFISYKKFKSGV